METFSDFADGFAVAATPTNLALVLVGVLLGMVIGVLPGLGPTTTIAILLPVTFALDAPSAIIMLAGIYYGAMYGGTITSVLVKVPGEIASVVTTFDGHQMARQGRAGPALGIAAIGSFVGGTVAIFVLVLLARPLASFAERFGPPELFLVAVIGIVLLLAMGGQSLPRAGAMVAVGLILASVGQDPVTGSGRFTFGSLEMLGGLDLVAIAMGLFGLSEVLSNTSRGSEQTPLAARVDGIMPNRQDFKDSAGPIARGTVLGSLIGLVPGGGSVLASMASYSVERKVSKHPEKFGHGAIEGVAGPETANNAGSTMSFLPLLTLGLPTGTVMALLYGALLLQGVTPGPTLVSDHPEIFWGVMASMLIGNVILLVLNLPLVGLFVQLLRVRMGIISIVTVIVTLVGVYSLNNSMFDIATCIVAGIAGHFMRRFGFQPGPLVLAAVLGSILEINLRNSLAISDGSPVVFVTRDISLIMVIILAVGVVGLASSNFRSKRRRTRHQVQHIVDAAEHPSTKQADHV
ncbi:tripartite tricarboxylate transporter permease [Rhodococcus fascians]|nr:tripartite tricarboxylate transporter permease [Rhodococcus fascians]MBY3998488.1 tripartite tricarboxylate transporter permease [Rhodococcus fascians]MBY4004518.1 tripartite tricarboxylate transporter permease [Rhodococcus fascians]MBY4009301.1 tripartite tricarboxylate transporter permease [Rhodococcus fascians]MBY4019725.1 tripartite tricarboxylate transporter permease [Rhodococcus fascians]